MMDTKLEKEKVIELSERIEIKLEEMVRQYVKCGADGVFFCEDWGTQNKLLISPTDWVEIFQPLYERFCNFAAENNITVWMHSCGYIYEIIPYLIETGIKVLQLDQPELMGIERLGKEFGGKITFWSPCDIQKILPTGDKELIEASIRCMYENWFINGGGLIAKSYGTNEKDLQSIGVRPEWNDFAYKCFLKYSLKIYTDKALQ